ARSIAIDSNGDIFVTGSTSSSGFPTTIGAYEISLNETSYNDVFVSKLNSEINKLISSTFLGGSGSDEGYSLAVDKNDNVNVTGWTTSSDFPTSSESYDTFYNGDNTYDVFITKLSNDLTNLIASTYLGGNSSEYSYSLATDTSNNVYITGNTTSSDFPITSGAYDTSYNGGTYGDVFVSKFNETLTTLLSSTYIGSELSDNSSDDYSYSIAIDSNDNIYIAGHTSSLNYPVTNGAYDTSFDKDGNGGNAFITKINNTLTDVLASTFFGKEDAYAKSVAIDSDGNVIIAGYSGSRGIPTTTGAYDTSFGGYLDVFLAKFNSDLTDLIASTYLGGESYDEGWSVVTDSGGNIYATGKTESSDFSTTSDAYDNSYNGGYYGDGDIFISKFNNDLTNLLASTFLGGAGNYYDEYGFSISLDSKDNVYVAGITYSSDFPTTSNAYDTSYNGNSDAFISKFDNDLSAGVATPTPTPTPVQTDTTSPVGSISINNGAGYTNTRAVTLSLTATDDVGVIGYYVSNSFSTPAASASGWKSITSTTSYSADISYTLSSGDGAKTLYAWYKDAAGNVSDTASDSITLATATSPTPTPESTPTPTTTVTTEPTSTPSDEDLLEKYAPILYMHKEEDYHPKKVDEMLSSSYLYKITKKTDQYGESYYEGEKVKKINGVKIKEITSDILMQEEINDDLHYLKLKKKPSKYTSKEDQTVYARQTSDIENGNEKTILQYWFFYIYNDWGTTRKLGNYHEGDWEMIQIILGKNNNEILQPEKISYSFHHGGETFGWDEKDEDGEKKVKKKGNHPYVYVTLGGHGCWNSPGDHIWYQEIGKSKITDCWKCTDVTDSEGNVLYPKSMSNDEISEIEFVTSKYAYIIEDMTDWENEDIAWIYWRGYWGKQTGRKMNNKEDYGKSGPPSPPYIDYVNDVEDGEKSKDGRWYKPIEWANDPEPSNYELCNSDNSKVVVRSLSSKNDKYSDYCNWTSDFSCDNVCSNLRIIYSEEDLQFDAHSLDGEEVTLKISRYNRDTKEVHEVEFDWLEIQKNGRATLTFSPEKNPNFEIMVDNDLDNVTDRIVMPDYSTQYQR
ncbi:MAG: hypothetical protein FJY07_04905, partial [Bacteroidetes bacterium]|nr:hypothetical protein [Bacteroidota bacterium]